MLDNNEPDDFPIITYAPKIWNGEVQQNKNENKVEYFKFFIFPWSIQ